MDIVTTSSSISVPSNEECHFDATNGLDVVIKREFLNMKEEEELFHTLKELSWYRVCYESERHKNSCETPCWTNFYGGFPHLKPYQPIPSCFDGIIQKVSAATGNASYNAILLRLYFDGSDNIAWHTDGRTFLGKTPTIASLSLGSAAKFQMRKMTNVWPCKDSPNGGVDATVPPLEFTVHGGDLLVMQGKTQDHWHHRVPKEKSRGPRININFRNILDTDPELSLRGIQAFYKYMVSGDAKTADWDINATPFNYKDIVKRSGPIHQFVSKGQPSVQSVVVNDENERKRRNNEVSPIGWSCAVCTYNNEHRHNKCEMCDHVRPYGLVDTSKKVATSSGKIMSYFAKKNLYNKRREE